MAVTNGKLDLKNKQTLMPRNSKGDVAFTSMEQIDRVFEEWELVALINRAIYQMEYQRDAHKKYQNQRQNIDKPFKLIFKRLFPGASFINMNPVQEQAVMDEYAKGARE